MVGLTVALATFACFALILYVLRNAGLGAAVAPVEDAPYTARSLVSPAERSFFGVLDRAVGDRALILVKVRLGDILAVRPGLSRSSRASAWNRIRQKHVDFVLCSRTTLDVLAAVELDDASHGAPARRNRDLFVDRALAAGGIPVHRFSARGAYSVHEVRRVLDLALLKGSGSLTSTPGIEPLLPPAEQVGPAGEWPELDQRGRGAEAAGPRGGTGTAAPSAPRAREAAVLGHIHGDAAPATQTVIASGPVAVLEGLGGCPRCGAALVERTAKRGANAGAVFLACSAFPACRYTAP